jgi:hypothetical protein
MILSEQLQTNNNSFTMILRAAMNVPGVQIRRNEFLYKELSKHYSKEIVAKSIDTTPANAGITVQEIEKIANSCINFETTKVSLISVAAGIPGGFAMFGTIPADIAQYFAHIVRVLQKLIYLYGWKEIIFSDEEVDDETINLLTLFVGIMFGVNAANNAITKIAQSASKKAETTIANKALTKGVLYPVVKKVAAILGVKVTKDSFAKVVSKVIPVIGGVASGVLTYASFKPSAIRLKKYLKELSLADPNACQGNCGEQVIDVDFEVKS